MLRYFTTLLFLLGSISLAGAQSSLRGSVLNEQTQEPVAGVKVSVAGSSIRSSTDVYGEFVLPVVPAGTQIIRFSSQGYTTRDTTITISTSQTESFKILLSEDIITLSKLKVEGRLQGQVSALNLQKTADNIKNVISSQGIARFPDQNSAEALQRVSGITVTRDQGEGRYVQIRGGEPRYTSVNINGVSIPSPEGDIRNVAMDVIPSDVLGQIEVSKAITPDMDGDAISGSVNLKTLKATSKELSMSTSASMGYNALIGTKENGPLPLNGQFSASTSKRFGVDEKIGLILGGSYMLTNRGSDNIEYSWDGAEIEELELRDYLVTRDRLGVHTTLDAILTPNASVYFSGLYNRFGDQEYRRRTTLVAPDNEVERELKDRYEVQDILALSLGSDITAGKLQIQPRISYSFAQEDEPGAFYSIFKMEPNSVTIDPQDKLAPTINSSTSLSDASSYELDAVEKEDNITKEANFEGATDFTFPLLLNKHPLELKAGVKARKRMKMRDNFYREYSWEGDESITMDEVQGEYNNPEFFDGNYKNSAKNFQDPDKIEQRFDDEGISPTKFARADEVDLIEDNYAGDYYAEENVGAGFLQVKSKFGMLTSLAGVRIENTGMHYEGYNVDVSRVRKSKVRGYSDQMEILPMVHFKVSPTANFNIRAAYTKTFARPNFYDLVPYYLLNDDGDEAELGNPDLENTQAHNGDFTVEYYFPTIGIASMGVFAKSLTKFTYTQIWEEGGIEKVQPINGDEALIGGVELAFEKQLSFLPSVLNGFGVGGNYTYTWSEADIVPDNSDPQESRRTIAMPGQAAHTANGFVQYEKYGISARVALNYHSEFIEEVGEEKSDDRYYAPHTQLDLSASYKILQNHELYIFAEAVNITNEPLYYYSLDGDEEIPLQQEYYSWWSHFGVKYSF